MFLFGKSTKTFAEEEQTFHSMQLVSEKSKQNAASCFQHFLHKIDLNIRDSEIYTEKKQQNIEQSKDYEILQETGQEAREMQKLSHQSDPEKDPLLLLKEKVKRKISGFGKIESEQNIFPTIAKLVFLQTIVF